MAALPTPALAATASTLIPSNPSWMNSATAASRIAWWTWALRGRPGGLAATGLPAVVISPPPRCKYDTKPIRIVTIAWGGGRVKPACSALGGEQHLDHDLRAQAEPAGDLVGAHAVRVPDDREVLLGVAPLAGRPRRMGAGARGVGGALAPVPEGDPAPLLGTPVQRRRRRFIVNHPVLVRGLVHADRLEAQRLGVLPAALGPGAVVVLCCSFGMQLAPARDTPCHRPLQRRRQVVVFPPPAGSLVGQQPRGDAHDAGEGDQLSTRLASPAN